MTHQAPTRTGSGPAPPRHMRSARRPPTVEQSTCGSGHGGGRRADPRVLTLRWLSTAHRDANLDPSSDQHCHAHLNVRGPTSSCWTSDVRRPAAAGARPAKIARRYGRHESLHLIAHRNPGLPAGKDGWPDCPLGVAGTRRPRHACIACGAPPGPVHRGRRVTQTGQSADEHRVRAQRMSVGASGRRGFLHVAGLVELVELRHLLATFS